MALDGLRAGLLVAALLVPSALFVRLLSAQPPGAPGAAWWPVVAGLGLAGAAGVTARGLGARARHWPALAAGCVLGALLVRVFS